VATFPPTHDRSLQNRRVWLAPVCLCLVAALHLWRVTTASQTPWKGGGFGMFSTIDAEHARFVRAWLVTEYGERPIIIPQDLEKKVAELRAAPQQAGLDELAARLAERGWIDPRVSQQQLAEQLQRESNGTPLTNERLQALLRQSNTGAADAQPSDSPVSAKTPHESAGRRIPFAAIRVELWKYEMPAGTFKLQTQRLHTAISVNKGGQP
jgi:hypothetical protein